MVLSSIKCRRRERACGIRNIRYVAMGRLGVGSFWISLGAYYAVFNEGYGVSAERTSMERPLNL